MFIRARLVPGAVQGTENTAVMEMNMGHALLDRDRLLMPPPSNTGRGEIAEQNRWSVFYQLVPEAFEKEPQVFRRITQ